MAASFLHRDGDDLISVRVQTTSGLVMGERMKLLEVIRTERESRPTRVDIVINWFDEPRGG